MTAETPRRQPWLKLAMRAQSPESGSTARPTNWASSPWLLSELGPACPNWPSFGLSNPERAWGECHHVAVRFGPGDLEGKDGPAGALWQCSTFPEHQACGWLSVFEGTILFGVKGVSSNGSVRICRSPTNDALFFWFSGLRRTRLETTHSYFGMKP